MNEFCNNKLMIYVYLINKAIRSNASMRSSMFRDFFHIAYTGVEHDKINNLHGQQYCNIKRSIHRYQLNTA